ncbi:MAG TPA: flagellar motor protein MotB [Gemmatimonadales bacterium]|nr:flagellar motor protein MotB [Gemmatimonadales bacterium]
MNKDRETIIIVRKRKSHGHGHHGGAWKVAFADFMTSMMALFLVLWLITQSSDVKSAIAGYFQDPLGRADEFGSSIIPGEGAQAANPRPIPQPQITDLRRDRLQMLGERIKQALAKSAYFGDIASQIEIELTGEGLRISLLEDSSGVFFETGSAHPRPAGVALLGIIGEHLATLPNDVVVDGYTDAVPYSAQGGTYTNWELSADRANTSRRILVAGGLREGQMAEVRGHADNDLRLPSDPRAPSNRRVTITMLFDEVPLPVTDSLGATAAR